MVENLKLIVREQLKLAQVTIQLSSVGTNWVEGEFRMAYVHIRNTTGLPLRDVVARLHVSGAARVEPVSIVRASFDNEASWAELDPWEHTFFRVALMATGGGTAFMYVFLWAEVVPYVSAFMGSRSESVIAD